MTTRSQISEPIEPPPPVTTVRVRTFDELFQPPIIDKLTLGRSKGVFDIHRRQSQCVFATVEFAGGRLVASPSRRASISIVSGWTSGANAAADNNSALGNVNRLLRQ